MKEGIQQHHHTLHPIHSLHYDFEAIFRAIQKSSDENTFENFLSFFSEEDQAILRAHIDSLYQVKGTPFENFTILLLTSFVGLFPSSIGGMLAHNMPLLEKDYSSILLLATAPTVFSSLRFLTAHLTDKGYGKEVIQSFLVCSILGQLGVSYLLKTNDLSTIQAGDFAYYAFLAASSFSSAAAATFPTCILLGKNTATNDTIEEQRERLVKFSEKNIQVQLSTLERHFNGVLRQKRTTRTMYLAGFGNFAPVLALTLMAQQTSSAPPSVSVSESIRNAHISNLYNTALILSVLALASTFFLKKPLVRQLMATHVTEEDARKLADILGQPHPPNHDSFYRKLRQFQSKDLLSVGAISFYYAASFASLMMLTSNGVSIFTRLGFQPTTAIYNTAWVLGLSTSVRTYLPFLTLPIRPAEITSLSFFAMALLSYAISITSDKYLQGLFIFILFPIFNGAVNFSVPREALEVVSENKQGLLTGFYTAAAGVAPLLALLTPYLASLQEKAGHKSMLPEYTVVSFISALAFSISVFQYCCAHTKRHEKNVTQALLKHALHKPIPNYGTAPSQNDGKIIINAAPL